MMGVARIFFGWGKHLSKVLKKNFLRKFGKMHYFRVFFKILTNHALNSLYVWTKNANFWEILRKPSKNLLWKLLKWITLEHVSKSFTENALNFMSVWTKNANSCEILREFSKKFKRFLRKIAKNALFLHIFKKVNNACVKSLRVWTKTQIVGKYWENIENLWWQL